MPGRPPSSARPPASRAGRPTTSFGQPGQPHYELEEEEYDDESEDDDVFAFLPPTTAEQDQEQQREVAYTQPSPFSHSPFAHNPQYPQSTYDPLASTYPLAGQSGQLENQQGAVAGVATEQRQPYSYPAAAVEPSSERTDFAATPATVPYPPTQLVSQADETGHHVSQPPPRLPVSPPSPSTDSVPSTGISQSIAPGGIESFKLKRMDSLSERGDEGRSRQKKDSGRAVKVNLRADESSDGGAASEKEAHLQRSLSLTKDDILEAGSERDVEAAEPVTPSRQQELSHRRQGKRASRGEGNTTPHRTRNPNAQPYWSYAQQAREYTTVYGTSAGRSTGVSTNVPGTSTSAAMTAGESTAHTGTLDESFAHVGKRHGSKSLDDRTSLSHSMMDDDVRSEATGSIKLEFDFDAIDEEDSPFPEVRASVSNIDDPDMPAMTLRMWVIGLILCISSSAFNVFFNFRYPAPQIYPLALLLVSYPCGKLLAFTLPITTYRIPLPRLPRSLLPINQPTFPPLRLLVNLLMPLTLPKAWEFSLNPGPWNIKEHVLVFIMSNVAIGTPYALNAIVVSEVYYDIHLNYWFSLTFCLATQLTGFGLAGLCRRFLVWPASMVWPSNLVACTLLNTLHAEDDDDGIGMYGGPAEGKRGMSRYKFFLVTTSISVVWFFLPGYLFSALSFFSFVCWAAPNNVAVNQLFGVRSGLGMSVLTFDWTQISWVGSPLMVPWWAQVHVFVGFVMFYWILTPILYYTNSWSLSHFPMSANIPYDRFGKRYNVSRVLRSDDRFDEDAYLAYSPLYLPATYAVTYLLAFALSTCVLVHTILYHGRTLINGVKKVRVEADDIHAKLMRYYPEVPDWWYASAFCVFFCLAIVAVEVWDTSIPVWALLLSILLPVVYILPSGFIYAMTGQGISLNILAQIIPGTLLPGNPFANMVFKAYSVQTLTAANYFVQDLKLGHYVKVPPRATFLAQMVCTILAAFIQVGVKQWLFDNVPDVCSPEQKSNLICPHNQVFYTASAVWGLIGPMRQFGKGSIYHPHLYALAIGVALPFPLWLWSKRYPKSWARHINTPVVLSGISQIPPATGINYSSWFAIGYLFQYLIRKKNFGWWSKFNYVLSSALDSGTVIAVLVIFFTLQFPKGGKLYVDWWGNNVYTKTADWRFEAYRPIPEGGLPWSQLREGTPST